LFCIAHWDFVLEFGAHKARLLSFYGDSCFVACNSHAHLATVGSRKEPVAYTDAVGHQLLPVVVRYQKLSLYFVRHSQTSGQSYTYLPFGDITSEPLVLVPVQRIAQHNDVGHASKCEELNLKRGRDGHC